MPPAQTWLRFEDLGLSPIVFSAGPVTLHWYAVAYVAMVAIGWWYLRRLVREPGAPMSRDHVDDLVGYVSIGVLVGGRLGYCLVYRPSIFLHPLEVFALWNGGMSLHGGLAGVLIALWLFARRNGLDLLRVCDYVACATPFGLFLVRIANFVNGELWGRPSHVPWAMIFPGGGNVPRHPSQLYEAFLEGGLAMLVLAWMFWRTDARWRRGRLFGTGLALYGVTRFLLEFTRQPDAGLEHLPWGLSMGQTLCLPMIAAAAWVLTRPPRAPAPAAASAAPPG